VRSSHVLFPTLIQRQAYTFVSFCFETILFGLNSISIIPNSKLDSRLYCVFGRLARIICTWTETCSIVVVAWTSDIRPDESTHKEAYLTKYTFPFDDAIHSEGYEMVQTYGVVPNYSSEPVESLNDEIDEARTLLGSHSRVDPQNDGHATLFSSISNLLNTIIGSGAWILFWCFIILKWLFHCVGMLTFPLVGLLLSRWNFLA